jgi:integrase
VRGHVRQRSPGSFEIRWRVGQKVVTRTIRGSKKDAERALRHALVEVDHDRHVDRSRLTVAMLLNQRIAAWSSAKRIGRRSRELYMHLAKTVGPIGEIEVQRLTTVDVEMWHITMVDRGLSTSARRGAHGLLCRALNDARRHKIVGSNAAADQGPPPAGRQTEVVVPTDEQTRELLAKVAGTDWEVPVLVAVYCGVRRSEQLAARWSRLDLDGAKMQIFEALDEAGGKVFVKAPKTSAGRRTISLPTVVVEALRGHKVRQLETAMLLGLGRPASDALVFPGADGAYDSPHAFSSRWGRAAKRFGVPDLTWHSLRHAHASMLIAAKVPITTVAARLGHADASVTLRVYARMFSTDDAEAAQAVDAALGNR